MTGAYLFLPKAWAMLPIMKNMLSLPKAIRPILIRLLVSCVDWTAMVIGVHRLIHVLLLIVTMIIAKEPLGNGLGLFLIR